MVKFKVYFFALILVGSVDISKAVSIDSKGLGEVLIYPYYTVNNDFNTIYTVVNTTNQAKAIKVRFLEGENNAEVLLFNVYLSPYDVWVGQLSPTNSTVSNHVGELSGKHFTSDNSCAPFLDKTGQEFLPYVFESDAFIFPNGNGNLKRSTEGHIEVMELGVLDGDSADAAEHNNDGIPEDCEALEQAWSFEDSYWITNPQQDISDPTGGLFGSATLLNVSNGVSVSYDAVALANFWEDNPVAHTSPGGLLPDLNSANPETKFVNNGDVISTNWSTGFESISALLMQQQIFNQYHIDQVTASKTEWVITFPTKKWHVSSDPFNSLVFPPFSEPWNGSTSCETSTVKVWDDSQLNSPSSNLELCYGVNTIEILEPATSSTGNSELLGSDNLATLNIVDDVNANEAGWLKLSFEMPSQMMTDSGNRSYSGLPAVGFMINQHTNASGPVGILSKYAELYTHSFQRNIQVDLIFDNHFE